VVPLNAMEAHLGDRRYSSYSFLTSALEVDEWSASRPGRALPPVPTVQEAGWAREPVWTQRLEGDRTPAVQSIVRHSTDWATAALFCVRNYPYHLHADECAPRLYWMWSLLPPADVSSGKETCLGPRLFSERNWNELVGNVYRSTRWMFLSSQLCM
jgi:hypothetical protein